MFASLICSHTFDGCKLRNTTALDWREEGHFMLDPCCWYVAAKLEFILYTRIQNPTTEPIPYILTIRNTGQIFLCIWLVVGERELKSSPFGTLFQKEHSTVIHSNVVLASWSNIGLIANIMIFSATLWVY